MKEVKGVKAAKYSEADLETLRKGYTGVDNTAEVAALAQATGKSPASVRAKLASMGLYRKAEAVEAEGERITKMVLAESIGEKVDLLDHEVEGLAKASKSALAKVLAKLA